MLPQFNQYLKQLPGVDPSKDRFLLAVSGGLDSVAMTELFVHSGYAFGVAHVNFKLRGADSDEDEAFVSALAAGLEVPYWSASFDTGAYAQARGLSIQMAARELRYDWLEQVRVENGYDWIVTAHHGNDAIETFLYNFTRGAGLRGLTGIAPLQGRVIRPLLFASREELEDFVRAGQLPYREDKTNEEQKYIRNKIRHGVTPVLKEINPDLEHTASRNLEHLREALKLYEWAVEQFSRQAIRKEGARLIIDKALIKESPAPATTIFEILQRFGFRSDQADMIWAALDEQPGKYFYSNTHQLVTDRGALILEKRKVSEKGAALIIRASDQSLLVEDGKLELEFCPGRPENWPNSGWTVCLNPEALQFPLLLRHWLPGDTFCPLGMGGRKKKLQDFFSDQKIDRFAKDRIWILENGDGRIAWIVGYRMDERFRLPESWEEGYWKLTFVS